jgi:16S rRNA processing protein RimM
MLEPADQQYVMIGYIAQSHGVDGTVLIIPEFYAPDLFETVDLVRLQDTRGDLVPARIESVRVQQKNNRLSFFVKFDHITDRNESEALKNYRVYVNRHKVEHFMEEQEAHSLVSFEVKNEQNEPIGVIDDIVDNPAHLVLVVQTEHRQLLIPFVDEYVQATDEANAIIHCKNLEQLMDL